MSASSPQYPGVTFGPFTRASRLVPTGVSLNSSPGTGSPSQPALAPVGPVQIANGAVSVAPNPVMKASSSPQASNERSRSSSQKRCPSPAAA